MFIIYPIDLSTKNKRQRRGHISTKTKNTDGWKLRKKIVSVTSFQKFLIFLYGIFQKMLSF